MWCFCQGFDVEPRPCLLNLLCDLCIGLTEAFCEAIPELSDRDNDSINRLLVLTLLPKTNSGATSRMYYVSKMYYGRCSNGE